MPHEMEFNWLLWIKKAAITEEENKKLNKHAARDYKSGDRAQNKQAGKQEIEKFINEHKHIKLTIK